MLTPMVLVMAVLGWQPAAETAQEVVQDNAPDVLAAERALASAMQEHDSEQLERLLAPEFLLRGAPDTGREAWLKNALTLCWGERADITDYRARIQGYLAAASFVLTFDVDPTSCTSATERSLVTDLWTRESGEWRLLVRHATPLAAPEAAAPAEASPVAPALPVWDIRGEVSALATAGNASTQTVGLSGEVARASDRRTSGVTVAFVTSEADDVTNARSLNVQARHGVRVRERLEVFGRLGYVRDRFAGIENREIAEIGASFRAALPQAHALTAEAGVGATVEDRTAVRNLRFATGTGTIRYVWTPAARIQLGNEVMFTADLQTARNWRATSTSSFSAVLTRLLSLKASEAVEYRNLPVPGFRRADLRTSLALVVTLQRRPIARR